MRTDGRLVAECVQYTDRERRVHQVAYLIACHPTDLTSLCRRVWTFITRRAAENERDNASRDILVHTRQPFHMNVHTGFFGDFAAHTIFRGLVKFEHSPRRLPVAVILAPNGEHSPAAIDYHTGDAH